MEAQTLERILEVSRRMAEMRQLDPLLTYALQEAIHLVGAEQGYLVLLGPDNSLDFRVKLDSQGNELAFPESQISTTILSEVITTREPLLLMDALSDSEFSDASSVTALGLRSVLCSPLVARGNVIGAMYVENRTEAGIFEDDDMVPLILFANQAAVAIENAVLNDDLEASLAEARAANRLKSEFLATTSHELRTPLNSMIGFADLLLVGVGVSGPPLSQDAKHLVSRIRENSKHLLVLINDILDMSRIEAGRVQAAVSPIKIRAILDRLIEDTRSLNKKPVQITQRVASDFPETILGDEALIERVIANLLSNALKFTAQGSVTVEIDLSVDPRKWTVRVGDTGVGIPPEAVDLIFEPFRQADGSWSREYGGVGLGLAICRHFVETMGGTIELAQTEVGVGSMFLVTLPLLDHHNSQFGEGEDRETR